MADAFYNCVEVDSISWAISKKRMTMYSEDHKTVKLAWHIDGLQISCYRHVYY